MSGLSGNNGTVLVDTVEVARVISWDVSVDIQQTKRTTSATAPWPSRTVGNKDITGSFTIQLDDGGGIPAALQTALINGTTIALELEQVSGKQIEGDAKMENMSTSADIDGGEDQQATFTFGADGTWTIANDS